MTWVVYMIECSDGSIYTGISGDMARRWIEHRDIKGSKYTGSHRAVKLLWTESHEDEESAEKREMQIKRWTRRKKLALASGDLGLLKKL